MRLEGDLLRLFFRSVRGAGTQVRAGFSVSARLFNAVSRNRVRRLLRRAFEVEGPKVKARAEASGCDLEMLFVYKGSPSLLPNRMRLSDVLQEMAELCSRIKMG